MAGCGGIGTPWDCCGIGCPPWGIEAGTALIAIDSILTAASSASAPLRSGMAIRRMSATFESAAMPMACEPRRCVVAAPGEAAGAPPGAPPGGTAPGGPPGVDGGPPRPGIGIATMVPFPCLSAGGTCVRGRGALCAGSCARLLFAWQWPWWSPYRRDLRWELRLVLRCERFAMSIS